MKTILSNNNPFKKSMRLGQAFSWEILSEYKQLGMDFTVLDYGAYDGKMLNQFLKDKIIDKAISVDLNHDVVESNKLSLIPGCLDGNQENHRHDQSILSILTHRNDCPRQDIDIFGYWTDWNRNLNLALELGSVIFAHRRGHNDKTNLIYEN